MRAMILAAGRGERMRPLTDACPKPMLRVGGKPLIVWHIERLVAAGITDIVINHAWLGQQIESALGTGQQYGARISYSPEPTALETAGGIARALPFFQDQAFLVINGDVWCDWNPANAATVVGHLAPTTQAWLLLVANPSHHPEGDFKLDTDGCALEKSNPAPTPALTFSGIGIYRPTLFRDVHADRPAPLAPLLRLAIQRSEVKGERHDGQWMDVGTPERLEALDRQLSSRKPQQPA